MTEKIVEQVVDKRVLKIKNKYGSNAFKKWGASGGSPVLRAWAKGKVKILK